jgi:hypothetical protein
MARRHGADFATMWAGGASVPAEFAVILIITNSNSGKIASFDTERTAKFRDGDKRILLVSG